MADRMPQGIRHDDLRRRNRALALGAVRRMGQASRTELTTATGLSPSTISAITADLVGESILREAGSSEGGALRRGRPQVAMALDARACAVLTVTLALDHLSAALIDYAGGSMGEGSEEIRTLKAPREALLSAVAKLARRAVGAAADGPVLQAVLAVQGITDHAGRTMLWSPITPWADLALAELIERETGVPATVENDCSAIAAALQSSDPAHLGSDFAAVLLSHGIGMGLVMKGEPFSGVRSSGAEFGHMIFEPHGALCRCGRQGCVEAYAGDYAIHRFATGASERALPSTTMGQAEMAALAARARSGERRAAQAFARAGEAVGFGLGSLFALIDPAPLVFVGSGTGAFDLMEPALREGLGATAGGARAADMRFSLELDEMPLIRAGCAARALQAVDAAIAAPGALAAAAGRRKVA